MKAYTEQEAQDKLASSPSEGWAFNSNSLEKQFIFKDFKEAMGFMAKAGDIAEKMNHHPDWSNVYNRVKVNLSTHDAGGVTDKDFELAGRMDELAH